MARGKALFGTIVCHQGPSYRMPELPAGTYYPIAVEIAAGVDKDACFLYREARRTVAPVAVRFPCEAPEIVLPLEQSPDSRLFPIPVNLPLLLHLCSLPA